MIDFKAIRFLGLGCLLFLSSLAQAQEKVRLHYQQPAEEWTEALPVGNGRLGAMVFGGVEKAHIQFNEETLWAGEPHDYSHKDAHLYLDEIRTLLAEGKQLEAQDLATEKFMSIPITQLPYQPFGDLYMEFLGHQDYSKYSRELDLENALTKVSYEVDGVRFDRSLFSSHPDQAIVIHIAASKKGALDFSVWLDAVHETKTVSASAAGQQLEVQMSNGVLSGIAKIKVESDGELMEKEGKLSIKNASQATIKLVAATNYIDFQDISADATTLAEGYLQSMEGKTYDQLKSAHLADYKELFDRFSLDLGGDERETIPTDKRIYDFWKNPEDPQLIALYVQYARYLMIASSRPGTLPPTLQGLWNDKIKPPWLSGYTTNINLEMNYWPVEMANLAECHEPLFDFIRDLSQTGGKVASEHYGAEGWVAHHNVDLWRGAAPVNASHHGIWVTGGAWLSTHIWEHYLFSQDASFLAENYSLMKEAALFFSQFLYLDPNSGYLISSPSNSPEIGGLVAGPTMDHQIIRALFRNTIAAAEVLGTDQDFAEELRELLPKIAPNKVGQHGQLQEWMEDVDDPENHHRHVSHLWAVHPGNEINYKDEPVLMDAAKQSLEYRGDNGTGWSLAWKVNFWARFLDGDRAYKLLHSLLSPAEEPERKNQGGSYPNLFDAHPPFQIDGNFGGAAGILELFVQSHLEEIDLLPALPEALPQGDLKGIRARGGFTLDVQWDKGKLTKLVVYSTAGQFCILQYGDIRVEIPTKVGGKYTFNGKLEKQ